MCTILRLFFGNLQFSANCKFKDFCLKMIVTFFTYISIEFELVNAIGIGALPVQLVGICHFEYLEYVVQKNHLHHHFINSKLTAQNEQTDELKHFISKFSCTILLLMCLYPYIFRLAGGNALFVKKKKTLWGWIKIEYETSTHL